MFNSAVSGIQAGSIRMGVSAHNVANINTRGYRAYQTTQSEQPAGGTLAHVTRTDQPTNYATEAVEQMVAGYSIRANIATIRTIDTMQESLLNILA